MTKLVERKIVSVVFCDLVGFTSLAERLDPEDLATVQSAYFSAVRETVGRYGGWLEKFIGDAAVALFGAQAAHDRDAEQAVRAALALIQAVDHVETALDLAPGSLQVRVGVSGGEVAVHPQAQPD